MSPSKNSAENKPEPLWTAQLEGGCLIAGYDFFGLTRKKAMAKVQVSGPKQSGDMGECECYSFPIWDE